MGENTAIEWATHTFNPWRGCQKVSPGCTNCYAETTSHRNPAVLGEWGPPHATERVIAAEAYWRKPEKWNRDAQAAGVRARVFCASLADVFEDAPQVDGARVRLWDLIGDTPWLTWLLLTKRPENVRSMVPAWWILDRWPANVWLGTSVEDQERAELRIPYLMDVPATVRFLSCEPLLGPVDLDGWIDRALNMNTGTFASRIHWVIVGGESGPDARPMHPEWSEALRDQCVAAEVPFFFKQWGEHGPYPREIGDHTGMTAVAFDGCAYPKPLGDDPDYRRWAREHDHTRPNRLHAMYRVGKKKAGRDLDGRTWDEFPQGVAANV